MPKKRCIIIGVVAKFACTRKGGFGIKGKAPCRYRQALPLQTMVWFTEYLPEKQGNAYVFGREIVKWNERKPEEGGQAEAISYPLGSGGYKK